MSSRSESDGLQPRKAIRRFDVFADVNRLEALREGRSEREAKGHGIWLAKVVAGRRFGRKDGGDHPPRDYDERDGGSRPRGRSDPEFKSAGGELQTDETFDEEIVARMGEAFYDQVFAPAIHEAVERGEQYEQFRDTIRKDWKPRR